MASDALGVGIGIIVACVIFKIICWILIYKNSQAEKKKLKARETIKLGRFSRQTSGVPLVVVDVEEPQAQVQDAPPEKDADPAPDEVQDAPQEKDADPAAADAVDSGHETDAAPDPSALAAGAIVGAAAAAAAASSSSSDPPKEEGDNAEDNQEGQDVDPPPVVAMPTDAGVVAMAIAGSEAAKSEPTEAEKKKKAKAPPAAATAAPKAVSDFDDYRNMRPKHLPPADLTSSPPPAQYTDPVQPAPANKQVEHMRRAMARKMKDNEGMDF